LNFALASNIRQAAWRMHTTVYKWHLHLRFGKRTASILRRYSSPHTPPDVLPTWWGTCPFLQTR